MTTNPPVFSDEIKNFKCSYYDGPASGRYAALGKSNHVGCFHHCRETFHRQHWSDVVLYCVTPQEAKRVAKFIRAVENKLKIKNKTICGPTTRENVMWIKYSKWWKQYDMRRNLLTLLMRAGRNYKGSISNVVKSNNYLRATKYAFNRFLKGHTKFKGQLNGGRMGWYYYMRGGNNFNYSRQDIDKLLT